MNYILLVLVPLINALFACILHEAAHVAVAAMFRIKMKKIGLSWLGFYTVREEGAPFDNMIVSLAGPLANLLFAALLFMPHMNAAAWSLFLANLLVGGVNLLPIDKSDGSRAAACWRKIESAKDGLSTEEIRLGIRGTGRTDMTIRHALLWLKKNPTGVLQLSSISHDTAKAMFERIKLAGGDVSRVRINA